MLTARVTHGRNGYSLYVNEAPLWAIVAEEAAETLCARLGHPLCRGVWPIGFRLGQWLLNPAGRYERVRWSQPLTEEEIRERFPESVVDR